MPVFPQADPGTHRMNSSDTSLPPAFSELERFVVHWVRETQTGRLYQRLSTKMARIQEFYDAITPRLREILDFVDQYPFGQPLPPEVERLFGLALSAAQIAPAVELFKQPAVVCGFDAREFLPTHEAVPLRPKMSIAPQSFV